VTQLAVSDPTALDLRGLVEDLAADPSQWSALVRHDAEQRHFALLHRDDEVEIWLVSWICRGWASTRSGPTGRCSATPRTPRRSSSRSRRDACEHLRMPVTRRLPGLVVTEHELEVPLDHAAPGGERLTVFAREVADPGGLDRPRLLFLQGGPGFEAPRPSRHPSSPGWLDRALEDYRVVLLDQRGTGRSTPVGAAALAGRTPVEQAAYLTHFRADAIVRDAEALREQLGDEQWSVLGQSFGGFTALAYLSMAPTGLREAMFTGGLPPIGRHPDEVYRATYARIAERTRRYYARYPEDRGRLLAARDAAPRLASGDRLSHARLRQLGDLLGAGDGAEQLHAILELPPDSPAFAHDVERAIDFARNPIYAILHESSYADGHTTGWSARRTLPDAYAEDPALLTGEHVYPWMFEELGALAPLSAAAELLAAHPWPPLYDRDVLASNTVPAAAAIYTEDMYVERAFSEETAAQVAGLRPWVTSEYEHDGLRADGGRILGRLIDLVGGRA
jgi:pimeloyl-ACP methyl ester carboxylesterase